MKIRSRFLATLVALGMISAGVGSAFAQELFTTQEDFAPPGWSDNNALVNYFTITTSGFSTDSSTTNGLGNTSNAGGAGTLGSMTVTVGPNAGTYGFFYSPGEQGNAAFLSALGTVNNGGAGYTASSATVEFDFVPPSAGTYFSLGIVLNYNDNFGQFFGGSAVNNGGFSTQDVPITINATGSSNYFQFGFIFNSDAPAGSVFTIDNVHVVPEPATLSLLGLGACGLIGMAIRRRRS